MYKNVVMVWSQVYPDYRVRLMVMSASILSALYIADRMELVPKGSY